VKWACAKVSPGCAHCYSEALAKRWNRGADYNAGEIAKLTPFLDEKELRRMLTYKLATGKRCFVGDMTDVFGEWIPDELLDRLFAVFALRGSVTWQVLTKRAERMRDYMGEASRARRIVNQAIQIAGDIDGRPEGGLLQAAFEFEELVARGKYWPLPNVWLGVSVEDQTSADERVYHLLGALAVVRFISAEPLLNEINLSDIQPMRGKKTVLQPLIHWDECNALRGEVVRDRMGFDCNRLDWVIVGGESGSRFRDSGVGPILGIARQCQRDNVPVFVKQDAHRLPGQQGRIPDEFWLKQFPAQPGAGA
jgi:protein gp37